MGFLPNLRAVKAWRMGCGGEGIIFTNKVLLERLGLIYTFYIGVLLLSNKSLL